jgi:hypothetical protein
MVSAGSRNHAMLERPSPTVNAAESHTSNPTSTKEVARSKQVCIFACFGGRSGYRTSSGVATGDAPQQHSHEHRRGIEEWAYRQNS